MRRRNKLGPSLALIFLGISLIYLFAVKGDGWAVPVALSLPVSILASVLADGISSFLALGASAGNVVATTSVVVFGMAEYYLIGTLIHRAKERSSAR